LEQGSAAALPGSRGGRAGALRLLGGGRRRGGGGRLGAGRDERYVGSIDHRGLADALDELAAGGGGELDGGVLLVEAGARRELGLDEPVAGERLAGGLDEAGRQPVATDEDRGVEGVGDGAELLDAVEQLQSAALTASSKPSGRSLMPSGGRVSTTVSDLMPSTSGRTSPVSTGVTSDTQ
jgi:hypothetical protein